MICRHFTRLQTGYTMTILCQHIQTNNSKKMAVKSSAFNLFWPLKVCQLLKLAIIVNKTKVF
jgi:hypothetical protein